jgi:DNA-binding response OmpR family regulator
MATKTDKKSTTNSRLDNVSILCVDNYIDSLELLKVLFEMQGARVYTAISAEEAVRICVRQRPDVLIFDLALPHGDGISLLKTIRSMGSTMPAIALTGISDLRVRKQALKAGFDHYLVKPADDTVLLGAVSELVSRTAATS